MTLPNWGRLDPLYSKVTLASPYWHLILSIMADLHLLANLSLVQPPGAQTFKNTPDTILGVENTKINRT